MVMPRTGSGSTLGISESRLGALDNGGNQTWRAGGPEPASRSSSTSTRLGPPASTAGSSACSTGRSRPGSWRAATCRVVNGTTSAVSSSSASTTPLRRPLPVYAPDTYAALKRTRFVVSTFR